MQDVSSQPLPQLGTRENESHKGSYGRVLIIGGSRGMAGAPALAGKAALRSGAGLVSLAVPRSIQNTVSSFEPSYMTLGFGGTADDCFLVESKADIFEAASAMTAVAIGPGLGSDSRTAQLVGELYQTLDVPMVVDADALNALARSPSRLENPGGLRVLTPHPGEFQRLTGQECETGIEQRVSQAVALCRRDARDRSVVVLKGHRTIIARSEYFAVNETGNPGMATGGTGDCLTGVIVALIAQGLSVWEAVRLGAHVHGLAGDLAATELGQTSLIANDLIQFLPMAFCRLQNEAG